MNRIARWARSEDRAIDYLALKVRLDFLGDVLFKDFEPTRAKGPDFADRLVAWLDSTGNEVDQQLMFELAGELYFIGAMEMELLYQDVLHGPIAWWLIDTFGLELTSSSLADDVDAALARSWFCPVTDSMQIARFHHINNVSGKNLRPDWHTLATLGDPQRIVGYMAREGLERLVLIEDFVGSGNQVARALQFLRTGLPDLKTLLAPLVICPSGLENLRNLVDEIGNGHVTLRPMVVLPADCILSPEPVAGESPRREVMRELLERLRPNVGAEVPNDRDAREELYGYGLTGALAVPYANCPNNVPPMVHHHSDSSAWKPLFPRTVRK